ncbi:MAG: hypothetical protein AAB336_02765 [Acidobacteriota bacterium]
MRNLALILIIFLLTITILSQEAEKIESTYIPLKKVIKTEGWKLPDLSKAKSKFTSETFSSEDNILITTKGFDLLKYKLDYQLESYSFNNEDKLLRLFTTTVRIRTAIAYSVREKNYAYTLSFVPYIKGGYDKKNKTRIPSEYLGTLITRFYFDEDGDGKFETQYLSSSFPKHTPEWVK